MTTQYLWARIAGPDPDLRAGDADRERVAERLRGAHAEGRLDMTEFQQRLEGCYAARTFGELRELVRDLPRQDEPEERRSQWLLGPWRLRLVPILLALVVVAAASGHHHFFWLWLAFWFLVWRMFWWPRRRWRAAHRRGHQDWL